MIYNLSLGLVLFLGENSTFFPHASTLKHLIDSNFASILNPRHSLKTIKVLIYCTQGLLPG